MDTLLFLSLSDCSMKYYHCSNIRVIGTVLIVIDNFPSFILLAYLVSVDQFNICVKRNDCTLSEVSQKKIDPVIYCHAIILFLKHRCLGYNIVAGQ